MSGLSLTSLGLATPLGLSTEATQLAIAGGISVFAETDVADGAGNPVRASRLQTLEASLSREDRILFFGRRALGACLDELDARVSKGVVAYVALCERDVPTFDEDYVMRGLRASVKRELAIDWSQRPYRSGRAGVFEAMEAARAALTTGRAGVALIGGLDSTCDRASLARLARMGRTLGDGNLDGLIPGEGAGFFCLTHDGGAGRFARLGALALGRDRLPFKERNPMDAGGLTSVFRSLREAHISSGGKRPQRLYSCQSSEGAWGRELSVAYLRNVPLMPEPFRTSLVASSMGDTGAAAAPIALGMAARSMQLGHRIGQPLDLAIVYGASDEGAVGGALIEAVG